MSFTAALLAPLALLPPAGGAEDAFGAVAGAPVMARRGGVLAHGGPGTGAPARGALDVALPQEPVQPPVVGRADGFRVPPQEQVRIEQHTTIRISPSRPSRPRPDLMFDMPGRETGPGRETARRLAERNIGRCVPVSHIARAQPDSGNRLILFLRDRRMISATLERACRARDFYSGFYIQRTPDGQLCVDRDTLLSRSGANCRITRIRQLIDSDD